MIKRGDINESTPPEDPSLACGHRRACPRCASTSSKPLSKEAEALLERLVADNGLTRASQAVRDATK